MSSSNTKSDYDMAIDRLKNYAMDYPDKKKRVNEIITSIEKNKQNPVRDIMKYVENPIEGYIKRILDNCYYVVVEKVETEKYNHPRGEMYRYTIYFRVIGNIFHNKKELKKVCVNKQTLRHASTFSKPGNCEGVCVADLRNSYYGMSINVMLENISIDDDNKKLISVLEKKIKE